MSDQLQLYEADIELATGQQVHLAYEEVGDILEVVFLDVVGNCALELTDHILLNFNREQKTAAGLTILDFSLLTAPTELGPRSFALTGLDDLPNDLRTVVIAIITQPPVNDFLKVVSYHTPTTQTIPLTYLQKPAALATV